MALTPIKQQQVNTAFMSVFRLVRTQGKAVNSTEVRDELQKFARGIPDATDRSEMIRALDDKICPSFNIAKGTIQALATTSAAPTPPAPAPRPAAVQHTQPPPVPRALARASTTDSLVSLTGGTPLEPDAYVPSDKAHALLLAVVGNPAKFKPHCRFDATLLIEDAEPGTDLHRDTMDAAFLAGSMAIRHGKTVTVQFVNSQQEPYAEIKDVNHLRNVLGGHEMEPSEYVDLSFQLSSLLEQYVGDCTDAKDTKSKPTPNIFYVISRGEDCNDTASYLAGPIEDLKAAKYPAQQLGMMLTLVGDSAEGAAHAQGLDDNKEFKRDHIDSIAWSEVTPEDLESVVKFAMGSVNAALDKLKKLSLA